MILFTKHILAFLNYACNNVKNQVQLKHCVITLHSFWYVLIAEGPLSHLSAKYRLGHLANIQLNIHFVWVFVLAQRFPIIYIYVLRISAFVCQILSVVPWSIVWNTGSSFPFKHWLRCIVFREGCGESTNLIQVFFTGDIVVNKIIVLYQGVITKLCVLNPYA